MAPLRWPVTFVWVRQIYLHYQSPAMLSLHPLGTTSLPVTRLGLGMAALGRPGYINLGHGQDLTPTGYDVAAMRTHSMAVLDAAYDAGIRYFDAARSYGRAEEFLAAWLAQRKLGPKAATIGSKWGYTYTADWQVQAEKHEVKSHTLEVLERQWGESQQHLGKHLDLYQIHSATLSSGVLDNVEVLNHLAELKREGVAIGLSLSGAGQADTLRRALALRMDGVLLFDTVQATWNLLERSATSTLIAAHDAGLGVIIKEALANGRLTDRNQDPAFDPQKIVLLEQAQRLHCSLDALALAAVLARPWVDVALSGASTVEQLQSNLHALTLPWDEEAEQALSTVIEAPQAYWKRRGQLAWN